MASVVECKNKNGTTYLYSNVTIWNKENKKYKYKREVIGKFIQAAKKIMYDKKPVNLPTP